MELKTIFCYAFLGFCIFRSTCCSRERTDFVEPLKNITAVVGSNLEFSCSVLHLGTSRVIWFHKAPDHSAETILAVNGLKVTKNPKISFTVIARSGDVTESILYIFNVAVEEEGTYTCGVNTDPMIYQKGLLEITQPKSKEAPPERGVGNNPAPRLPTQPDSPSSPSSSEVFCFNFHKIWKDTKKEAETLVKKVWKKFSSLF